MFQQKAKITIEKTSFYENKTLVEECNPAHEALHFLYTTRWGALLRFFVTTRRWWARLCGWYNNSRLSKRHIKPFIDAYKIDMEDFEVPEKGYASFNDFFIRKLKKYARQFDSSANIIVSPADSKLYALENVSGQTPFFVKDTMFNLQSFFDSKPLADYYRNGTVLVFRLAPGDYHRFHFPVNCTPTTPFRMPGKLDSVNPLAYKAGIQPLFSNERRLILLQTERFQNIAMVSVGATMVGKIVETHKPNQPRRKADECGYFCFGGSTVVLVFQEKLIRVKPLFLEHSLQGYETAVKMGESINY